MNARRDIFHFGLWILGLILLSGLWGCSQTPSLSRRGWTIQADAKKEEITIRQRDLGLLRVSFPGQEKPADWKISFKRREM